MREATDQAAAEQNYHRALAVAERQSAKTLGLRAATSLARLWRDQGKCTEARDLLAPVYGSFTEELRHAGPPGRQGAARPACLIQFSSRVAG
jgi:hypothetical protein